MSNNYFKKKNRSERRGIVRNRLVRNLIVLALIATLFIVISSIAYADDIIPNASKYFDPKSHPEVYEAAEGPMHLGGAIILAIGLIGILLAGIYIGKNIIKVIGGKVVSKVTWVGLGAGLCVAALLAGGGWYNLVNTGNNVIVKPSVKILDKSGNSQQNQGTQQQNNQQQNNQQQNNQQQNGQQNNQQQGNQQQDGNGQGQQNNNGQ